MSTATIVGCEVVSRGKMLRTAAVVIGVPLAILCGAVAAFTGPAVYRHYLFDQAAGRITGIRDLCHYQIKRFNKRGPAQVTGLVDCGTAYREAARIDHAMGEVKRIAVVSVDYVTRKGIAFSSVFQVPSEAATGLEVGRLVSISYDPKRPEFVHRRASNPFALTHVGRFRGEPSATIDERRRSASPPTAKQADNPATAPMAAPVQKKRRAEPSETIKTISWYIAWGVLAAMAYAIFWVLRFIWRLGRRGLARAEPAPPSPSRSPVAAARIATATRARTRTM